MKQYDLDRLNDVDKTIQGIVKDFGLSFMEQEFDVVPAAKMLEIMAYRLPVNFSHWSYGRDWEAERTKFEHGYSIPYEVVFNSEPCRAYLMETNPFAIQVLVMAHVYAHNDFMKNNLHFHKTRRDMISSASEAAGRLRRYEERYGAEAVEGLLDAALALQWNIDPEGGSYREAEEEAYSRLTGRRDGGEAENRPSAGGAYADLLGSGGGGSERQSPPGRRKSPPEPTVDLLGYISEHSPRRLAGWEKDVLEVVRLQGQYFMPYRRTKIMNEGWATYWHEKIMGRLFAEGVLSPEDHGLFNLYNARVKSHHPRQINPYLLGYKIFGDIEAKWNSGRHGPAYHGIEDAAEKREWDTKEMAGREKLFEVRRTHMDWFFVDEFLSKEVIDELDLYLYLEKDAGSHYETVVEETEWQVVKHYLTRSLSNWGIPRIVVADGDFEGSMQLYLRHEFEGSPLEEEYAKRTLGHIYSLWQRPVYLETKDVQNRREKIKLFIADSKGVTIRWPA